jgi:hypothetical protein
MRSSRTRISFFFSSLRAGQGRSQFSSRPKKLQSLPLCVCVHCTTGPTAFLPKRRRLRDLPCHRIGILTLTLSCSAAERQAPSSRRCTRPTTLRSPGAADQSSETCWAGGSSQPRPPGRREVTDVQSAEERALARPMDTQGKAPDARCSTVSSAPRSPSCVSRFACARPSVGGALLIME